MEKIIKLCDGCSREVEAGYLEIEKGIARLNNGKKTGHSIGFTEVKVTRRAVCSVDCLEKVLTRLAKNPRDYYMIGEGGENLVSPWKMKAKPKP